ncbi:MAG: hypothetical protein WBQ22_06770 [Bradyrhizobium sp.]
MTAHESDLPTGLDKAAEAVRGVTEPDQATSESIAEAIETDRRPAGLLDQVAKLAREAPISALATAFLFGFVFARRR